MDQDVYDVTDIVHPGGAFIFKQLVGHEIGRYFYGAYGLESTKMAPFKHSIYAESLLFKHHICRLESIDNLNVLKNKGEVKSNNLWKINESRKLSRMTSQFNFTNPSI